jgi:uncharacterized membrane-anchored protein YhcB (DUF1043 family)
MINMKNQKQKNLASVPLMITLALVFFSSSAINFTNAAEQENETAQETNGVSNLCQQKMRETISEKLEDYRQFMDKHFQNKSSTSSLLEDAMKKYDELFLSLNEVIKEFIPTNKENQIIALTDIADCNSLRDDAMKQARSFITSKAKTTSSTKQTTALLDKYKAINNKLGVLNKSMINLKSLMETLAVKIPCYLDKCGN